MPLTAAFVVQVTHNAQLYLVDLAGSEKADKTGTVADRIGRTCRSMTQFNVGTQERKVSG